jgi:hypothetical protein
MKENISVGMVNLSELNGQLYVPKMCISQRTRTLQKGMERPSKDDYEAGTGVSLLNGKFHMSPGSSVCVSNVK